MITQNLFGINIIEHSFIPKGKMVHDKSNNNVYVPDDGTYYALVFINGVNKESIDFACDYALSKVMKFIDSF